MEDELKKLSKEILGTNENDNRYSINSRLKYLSEIYGDLTAYITNKIEAEVSLNKIIPVA